MTVDLFRTRDRVADFDDKVAEYQRRSAKTRVRLRAEIDLPYGDTPAERLDLFFPDGEVAGRPVHIFIHGGYWRMFSKDDFSFVAESVVAAGAIAVIVDYALMPSVRLADVVQQVRNARRWVSDNIGDYGGDATRLTVSGHSAGAHLATFLFDESEAPSPVKRALLLGGIYDLKPLQSSFLQPLIELTDREVQRFSPLIHRFDSRVETTILYGERETAPFHEQAAAFAKALETNGNAVFRTHLKETDHMSSVRDLGLPRSESGRRKIGRAHV